MKVSHTSIGGKTYPLCFSIRVMARSNKKYGNFDGMIKALTQENTIAVMEEAFWLAAEMSEAGTKYTRLSGGEAPEPLTADYLFDVCGAEDAARILNDLLASISVDTKREIQTEEEKSEGEDQSDDPKQENQTVSYGIFGTL